MMNKFELLERTKTFSTSIVKLVDSFPKTIVGYELGKQIIRSGCSVGANYRASCRAKSDADFSYKISVVLEEADEILFWLELLEEAKIIEEHKLETIKEENTALVKIFAATLKTVRAKAANLKSKNRN